MRSVFWKLAGIFALLIVGDAAIWAYGSVGNPEIAAESHFVENAQAALLALGAILFFIKGVNSGETHFRILFWSLVVIYLTLFLLELEVGGLQRVYPIFALATPPIRNYMLIAAWLGMALVLLLNAKDVFGALRDWIIGLPGVLFILAGLFYGAARAAEQDLWSIALVSPVLLEEIMELNATVLMLFAALTKGRGGQRKPLRRRPG
jgi:hypothetical protein